MEQLGAPRFGQVPVVSGVCIGSGVQIPCVGETAQLWQNGHAVASQQYPSVQWPVPHWRSREQVATPVCAATQLVPLHQVPLAHWLSSLQPCWQSPTPQRYGAQSRTLGIEQPPTPLQVPAGWNCVALAQKKPTQSVPAAAWVQRPFVQVPVFPQGGLAGHMPCGSAVPFVTAAQLPDPQVWQVPHEGDVQQMPSTQLPVVHSWPSVHVLPGDFFAWHVPLVLAVQ